MVKAAACYPGKLDSIPVSRAEFLCDTGLHLNKHFQRATKFLHFLDVQCEIPGARFGEVLGTHHCNSLPEELESNPLCHRMCV